MFEKVYKCSEEKRKRALEHYYTNKEYYAEKAKNYRQKNKRNIQEKQRRTKRLKKLEAIEYYGGKCSDCNQTFHPAIYEFHHLDPEQKDRDPSKLFLLKWEKIINELDKCVLLCANCHRVRHHTWDEGNYND